MSRPNVNNIIPIDSINLDDIHIHTIDELIKLKDTKRSVAWRRFNNSYTRMSAVCMCNMTLSTLLKYLEENRLFIYDNKYFKTVPKYYD